MATLIELNSGGVPGPPGIAGAGAGAPPLQATSVVSGETGSRIVDPDNMGQTRLTILTTVTAPVGDTATYLEAWVSFDAGASWDYRGTFAWSASAPTFTFRDYAPYSNADGVTAPQWIVKVLLSNTNATSDPSDAVASAAFTVLAIAAPALTICTGATLSGISYQTDAAGNSSWAGTISYTIAATPEVWTTRVMVRNVDASRNPEPDQWGTWRPVEELDKVGALNSTDNIAGWPVLPADFQYKYYEFAIQARSRGSDWYTQNCWAGGANYLDFAPSGITLPNCTINSFAMTFVRTADGGYGPQFTLSITPPAAGSGPFVGCHLYFEYPDQSASGTMTVGSAIGSGALQGTWAPQSLGLFVYTGAAWIVPIPVTLGDSLNVRVYAASYAAAVENPLVRAGTTGETPSAVCTVSVPARDKSASGSSVTPLVVTAISATVLPAVTVSGKLRRPIAVGVDLSGLGAAILPRDWAYQLLGFQDNDLTKSPILASGYFRDSFTLPDNPAGSGPDGITVAHTFGPEEPTRLTNITIYAVAGLMQAQGIDAARARNSSDKTVFTPNLLISGYTASVSVTIGSTSGVVDPTAFVQTLLDTSVGVNNAVFGVLPLGVDNARIALAAVNTAQLAALATTAAKIANGAVDTAELAALAVAAGNLAGAAVTTPKLAALAVDAAALGGSAVTSTKIANLAVGSAAIAAAAVGAAAIASLAVGTAAIQTAAVNTALIANGSITNALIANLAVGTAQIQNLAVGDAQIANLSVNKLLGGTITATVSMTAPILTITSGTVTINVDASNFIKLTDSSSQTTGYLTNGAVALRSNSTAGVAALTTFNGGGGQIHGVLALTSSAGAQVLFTSVLGTPSFPGSVVGYLLTIIGGFPSYIPYYH